MDFPGGAITNIHATVSRAALDKYPILTSWKDGFSNIYWRIYTEDPPIPDANGEAPANGYTILKHLSRLKDLELRLRDLDCLVSCYPRRLGLWVFSATPDFEHLRTLCRKVGKDEQNRVIIGSSALKGL